MIHWNAFIGFGSISGRFGANGHTDYSLANDMLCKQMDWLRNMRPKYMPLVSIGMRGPIMAWLPSRKRSWPWK